MSPKISIVTSVFKPTYRFLKKQIDSYNQQNYKNFDVIFVIADQESEALVTEIVGLYSFDFSIVKPDALLGPREAFGLGIQQVINNHDSEYIALSDQDDIWLPTKLLNLLEVAEKTNACLVHSNAIVIDDDENVIKSLLQKNIKYKKQVDFDSLYFINSVVGMTSLFTIDTAKVAVPFLEDRELEPLHDWLLAIAASLIGRIEYVDLGLVLYRQHSANVIGAPAAFKWFYFGHYLRTSINAWRFACRTQPIIASTLDVYMKRCKTKNIAISNYPLCSDWKKGRLFACALSFIWRRKLHGLFAVIYFSVVHLRGSS